MFNVEPLNTFLMITNCHTKVTLTVTSPTTHVTDELNDFNFSVKSLKETTDHFDIRSHMQFAGNPTRSALHSSHHHFYFNRIVRLWNHLPKIDTSLSINTINCISMESLYYQL